MITAKSQSGFIALFSVIIISAILILMAITLSMSGFFGRFNILDSESKERANALVDACIDSARLAIATTSFTVGTTVPVVVNGQNCSYTISGSGISTTVVASANYNTTYTYYYVKVDATDSNLPITSFKECTNLSPCP